MARRENPGGSTRPTATTSPTSTNPDPLASSLNAGAAGASGTSNFGGVGGYDTGLGASGQGNNLGDNMDNNQGNQGNVAQQAKEQVRNLADDAKRETSRMANQAGDLVQGLVGKQKDQAAEKLGSVAGALRDVGNRLQEQDDAGFGQYAVRAADQVDRLSGYLRERDLNTFFRDTEGFARRHPDVFLGGTFLAGLLLARFLKSSSSSQDEDWGANAYASYPGYEGQMGRSRYAGEPFDDVNPQAYASYPGERFGRGAEFGGPPEPFRSEDKPGPYGTPDGIRFPDTPEGG
jgi:hypothetical protein